MVSDDPDEVTSWAVHRGRPDVALPWPQLSMLLESCGPLRRGFGRPSLSALRVTPRVKTAIHHARPA